MRSSILSAVMALATLSSAQTFSDCNPMKVTTCSPNKALGKSITIDFSKESSEFHAMTGTTMSYGSSGAEFSITKDGMAPTLQSNWYILFGKVEAIARAAPGAGIVSSIVLLSDVLDEIDWEWLGGDTAQVQTNYFGKGDTTTYDRGGFSAVASPQDVWHKYTIEWSATEVKWSINDAVVRTLRYADAKGGKTFPQTPCRVKLGSWVAGGAENIKNAPGTVQWAGGPTDFSQVPFNMYIKSLTVQDATTSGAEYVYSDMTGSWQSIKVQGSSGGSSSSPSSSSAIAGGNFLASSVVSSASGSVATGSVTTGVVSSPAANATGLATAIRNGTAAITSSGAGATVSRASGAATTSASTVPASGASKFGTADWAVVVLGLGVGYFFM